MLSPGQFYKHVPKDLQANLRYRRRVLTEARGSAEFRAALLKACKDDALFYINTFAWTFRPKAKGGEARVVPFVTWECQDLALRTLFDHIDRQRDLVAEKSRDMGWSWLCCFAADWHWRFNDHVKIGMFSRVADLVDSKDPDSLFWKLRFVQKWLPEWLWPAAWVKRLHDNSMYLENPDNGSVITGQATTKDMGVAGRCTWAVFDEFARVPDAHSVRDNTKDTSDCRVFVSTHTGPGTCFHGLCTNGVTDKIITHWSDHPERRRGLYRVHPERPMPHDVEIVDKSYPFDPDYRFVRDGSPTGGPYPGLRSVYYDQQARERSKADLKTNVDIDIAGGTSQLFDQNLIRRLIAETARPPLWRGDVMVDEEGKGRLVELETGPLELWLPFAQRGGFRPSSYVIGIDPAAGTGATPASLSIVDRTRHEKVGQYRNAFIPPERFARTSAAIGFLFAHLGGYPAKIGWDAGGSVGQSFGKAFVRTGYPNFYYRKAPMGFSGMEATTETPGYYFTPAKKTAFLLAYASALEKRTFINPSEDALRETLQFKWSDGEAEHATERNPEDPSGARSSHADMAIADALAFDLDGYTGESRPEPEYEPENLGVTSWLGRRQMLEEQDRMALADSW